MTPQNWASTDFDDSDWADATVHDLMREERYREAMRCEHVHPQQPRQHRGQDHPPSGARIERRTALRSGAYAIGTVGQLGIAEELLAAALGGVSPGEPPDLGANDDN